MFLNPTMLAGVAGAMLPLIVHLISRARYRNVQWGAMMFLGADDPAQSRWERIKQWSLVLLRMVAVALLAVALARPVFAPSGAMVDGPACTVIVLDRSGSMGIVQNGPARLESAIRAAAQVVSNLDRGDEVALITAPPGGGPIGPTTELRRFVLRIGDVTAAGGRADLAAAIDSAAEILEQSHAAFKHLVVISDRQAASWRDVTASFADRWRTRLGGSGGPKISFSLIPIGGQEIGNVAVESVQVANPPVIRDVPAEIEVRVHNYDTIPSAAIPLTIHRLTPPATQLLSTTVNLDAGDSTTIRCPVTFPEAGSLFIAARLQQPSGLVMDDVMEAGIEVTEPLSVLVISGDERDPSAESFRSEADFIRLALSPFEASGRMGPDMARVEVVSADAWPQLNRTKHQVVILANVPRMTDAQAQQLEQFIYGGGGLIVAPGNLARVDEYNSRLWRRGDGPLPVELLAPTPADGSGATTLLGLELSHQIFSFLQGRDEPIPRIIVDRHFRTSLPPSQSRVLGQYASGDAFMIENSYGRGRVILFTTPLDADWGRLARSNVYLPMLQSAVRYLAAGVLPDRNVWLNQPLVAMIDDPIEFTGLMEAPGNRDFPVELVRVGDAYEARFANTGRAGQYALHVETTRGEKHLRFSVRAPREESNITNLRPDQMASLQDLLGFTIREPEPAAIAAAVAEARRRWELWPWLLAAVAVLAVLEMGLARAWSATAQEVVP